MAPLESQLSIETTQAMQVPATLIGTLSMHALTKGLLMLTFIIYTNHSYFYAVSAPAWKKIVLKLKC